MVYDHGLTGVMTSSVVHHDGLIHVVVEVNESLVVEEGEGDLRGTVVVVGGKKIDFGMIAGGVNTVVQEMDADADTGEDDEEGK